MKVRIQKWGNSLAVRIPRAIANETGLNVDSDVELQTLNGQLVITPITSPEYKLDDLLMLVTDENLHDEIQTGAPVGNEAW